MQSTSLLTTLVGCQKGVLIRKMSLYPKSHYYVLHAMGLCSGHGNSVVIRELSLYQQLLLAKLTVCIFHTNLEHPEHGSTGTVASLHADA